MPRCRRRTPATVTRASSASAKQRPPYTTAKQRPPHATLYALPRHLLVTSRAPASGLASRFPVARTSWPHRAVLACACTHARALLHVPLFLCGCRTRLMRVVLSRAPPERLIRAAAVARAHMHCMPMHCSSPTAPPSASAHGRGAVIGSLPSSPPVEGATCGVLLRTPWKRRVLPHAVVAGGRAGMKRREGVVNPVIHRMVHCESARCACLHSLRWEMHPPARETGKMTLGQLSSAENSEAPPTHAPTRSPPCTSVCRTVEYRAWGVAGAQQARQE
jgi:hypothetical protein